MTRLLLPLPTVAILLLPWALSARQEEPASPPPPAAAPIPAPASPAPPAAPAADPAQTPPATPAGPSPAAGSAMPQNPVNPAAPGIPRELLPTRGQEAIDPATGRPIETLNEVQIRDRVERDVAPLLDDPARVQQQEKRDRELIDKHMDGLDKTINRWHLPLFGQSLAARAREKERQALREAQEKEAEQELEALRQTNPELYKKRRAEYHDTRTASNPDWGSARPDPRP